MRQIVVQRYVTPLREGGSLPAVVEGDDLGLYVLKFRGAGQGPRALIAEIIGGGIARALGLAVPEIVLADLDPGLAATEPDPEIQDLLRASGGLNVALDYLPGAVNFDPAADSVDADLASRVVWFDAFISNVDRTARNTNLLTWHDRLWLIDHGAALYFHHGWHGEAEAADKPFPLIKDHVLLPMAGDIEAAHRQSVGKLSPELFARILADIPDGWLVVEGSDAATFATPEAHRAAYRHYLERRLACASEIIHTVKEARDAA
jgi:hypothetical protein